MTTKADPPVWACSVAVNVTVTRGGATVGNVPDSAPLDRLTPAARRRVLRAALHVLQAKVDSL